MIENALVNTLRVFTILQLLCIIISGKIIAIIFCLTRFFKIFFLGRWVFLSVYLIAVFVSDFVLNLFCLVVFVFCFCFLSFFVYYFDLLLILVLLYSDGCSRNWRNRFFVKKYSAMQFHFRKCKIDSPFAPVQYIVK